MADITWDATLPQYVDVNGYREDSISGKIETDMDTGPRFMRNLYTAVPTTFTIQLTLTNAQVDTLETFYRTICKNGTLEFNWVHPRKPTTAVVMRFVGAYPSISYKAYDAYTVAFSVEVLP